MRLCGEHTSFGVVDATPPVWGGAHTTAVEKHRSAQPSVLSAEARAFDRRWGGLIQDPASGLPRIYLQHHLELPAYPRSLLIKGMTQEKDRGVCPKAKSETL
jgi:hypothetical protein